MWRAAGLVRNSDILATSAATDGGALDKPSYP
ncbi:MAG: hypothetical protein QOD02_3030, partial [Mycobacterium sp.]|nr:hypothetical protein [Mycobacterium sp.]